MTDWVIVSGAPVRPEFRPPLSYSSFRAMALCPLQFAFGRDRRYAPKASPRARLGSAFHETLAYISTRRVTDTNEAIAFFLSAVENERAAALLNYRERRLPWPKDMREVLENAIALRVLRLKHGREMRVETHIEESIATEDNLLLGRPDEVDDSEEGAIVVEYKTGRYDQNRLPDFEDQVHFYAGLWLEVKGNLPRWGRIEFLADNRFHKFSIDGARSANLVAQARTAAHKLEAGELPIEGHLGDHCSYCDYRPWCEDYWRKHASLKINVECDIEGAVCAQHARDAKSVCLSFSGGHCMIVDKSGYPLPQLPAGAHIRALDLLDGGATKFRTIWSELFTVRDLHGT